MYLTSKWRRPARQRSNWSCALTGGPEISTGIGDSVPTTCGGGGAWRALHMLMLLKQSYVCEHGQAGCQPSQPPQPSRHNRIYITKTTTVIPSQCTQKTCSSPWHGAPRRNPPAADSSSRRPQLSHGAAEQSYARTRERTWCTHSSVCGRRYSAEIGLQKCPAMKHVFGVRGRVKKL